MLEIKNLKEKIAEIREVIRGQTLEDLKVIRQITAHPPTEPIRYWDMAFLKEKIKLAILAQEKRNIQMLTCFSLENVINGLHILTEQIFGFRAKLKTIVLD